jgi:WXXGXW repeat (2 copies)
MKIHLQNFCLGLLAGVLILLGSLAPARAFISVSVGVAPPPLLAYTQPACPGDGYIWTPGYWAWDPSDEQYYWVPGEWALAPEIGFLWTPCWWGWSDGAYCFHPGYWGRDVGFYGGIAYGHGYNGHGYDGGYWGGGRFHYNRNVNNVGAVAASHVYSRAVATNRDRVSFNGGRGGVAAQPNATELRADRESHFGQTTAQAAHVRTASANTGGRFAVNHGQPSAAPGANPSALRASNAAGVMHHTWLVGESRFTGESVEANHFAPVTHHSFTEARAFRPENHAAVSRSHFSESRAPAFHAQSFHAQSFHAQSFHASSFHASSAPHVSASHGGGGGGGHGGHR